MKGSTSEYALNFTLAGLDPAIHFAAPEEDARVKPGQGGFVVV